MIPTYTYISERLRPIDGMAEAMEHEKTRFWHILFRFITFYINQSLHACFQSFMLRRLIYKYNCCCMKLFIFVNY